MNNLNDLHPHAPIPAPDVNQQHPITGQPLILAAMSLTSNSAVIAEIRWDQNIDDEYFADCVFPDATLTVLYYFDQVFTSRVTTKKKLFFFLFALNQKKIYRPSRPIFFPKS
jgi:hypothetical protein